MSSVPRIIHQIAPRDKSLWHPLWFKCQESWLKNFPDYQHMLWDDTDDIDTLVSEYYPEFKNLYLSFPFHIMRIDFARLCMLHKYGGIYGDMDYFVYKNFSTQLTHDAGFLQNLSNEYTTSEYENSLMYSESNNRLLYELMKYSKACFINFRRCFVKTKDHWRSSDFNSSNVNNSTGSGMLSVGINHFKKYFDIGYLEFSTFNNRPASYHKRFFGKHVHTTVWGKEYCNNYTKHFLVDKNGKLYAVADDCLEENIPNNSELIKIEEFDFYKDYTRNRFYDS